jgi:transcriptional regulator with XRE-family HTH domain
MKSHTMKTKHSQSPANKPKRFASVEDLVKATAADDGQIREFGRMLANSRVVNALIRTRVDAGMTQADVGEKMGRTQSSISKLEHSSDADLSIRDIVGYLKATGGSLNLGIGKQPNRVERIKELAICLKGELEALADLSSHSDDTAIQKNINSFFGEAWFNLFKILCDATCKLPEDDHNEKNPPLSLLDADSCKLTVTEKPEATIC